MGREGRDEGRERAERRRGWRGGGRIREGGRGIRRVEERREAEVKRRV